MRRDPAGELPGAFGGGGGPDNGSRDLQGDGMPVFISYSHQDSAFANRLAEELFLSRVHIWLDKHQLEGGESLRARIGSAIGSASALLVCLSRMSVTSVWCAEELRLGLLKELEESRWIIVPILLEDCDVPDFLKDRIAVDFRKQFEQAIQYLLYTIQHLISITSGRIEAERFYTDWRIVTASWEPHYELEVTAVQAATQLKYTILTQVWVSGNEAASKRARAFRDAGLDWYGRRFLISTVANVIGSQMAWVDVSADEPVEASWDLQANDGGIGYYVELKSTRLGSSFGSLGFELRAFLFHMLDILNKNSRELTATEKALSDRIVVETRM